MEQDGYEADDLIATYAAASRAKQARTVRIVSSDKDLMQLVGDRITLFDTMKDKEFGVAEVMEKFGVAPDKVVDVQALAGDSVDNVPGVPGIGLKTGGRADQHLWFDSKRCWRRPARSSSRSAARTCIRTCRAARISKRLVTLDAGVPVEKTWAALRSRAQA